MLIAPRWQCNDTYHPGDCHWISGYEGGPPVEFIYSASGTTLWDIYNLTVSPGNPNSFYQWFPFQIIGGGGVYSGFANDSKGDIIFTDRNRGLLWVLNSTDSQGPSFYSGFNNPVGVAVVGNNAYVAENVVNGSIVVFSLSTHKITHAYATDSTPFDVKAYQGTVVWDSNGPDGRICILQGPCVTTGEQNYYLLPVSSTSTIYFGYLGSSGVGLVRGLSQTLTVSCHAASVVVGSATTCKATVKGSGSAPTGTITWSSSSPGRFSKTSCKLSQRMTYSTCSVKFTPTAAGSVLLTANYGGDLRNPATAEGYNLVVRMKTSKTTVSCAPRLVAAGSPTIITCKAKVIGYLPTGTVTWSQSGTGSVSFSSTTCTLVSPRNPNQATCSVTMTGTTAGLVTLQATYGGNPNNLGSHRVARLTIRP
jgi:hypothetical protein